MPRYFIDTTNGRLQTRDDEGEDFADVDAARRCALTHLPALADADLPDGEPRDVSVTLRGEGGVALYVARLSYHGEWTGIAGPIRRGQTRRRETEATALVPGSVQAARLRSTM